jgi:hypothetical protein
MFHGFPTKQWRLSGLLNWGDFLTIESTVKIGVEHFDQVTLKKIADNLGVPHGRIR